MKKRLLSLILAFVMALGMVPGSAFAANQASEPVTAYLSMSDDMKFLQDQRGEAVALRELTVPYFDLKNYGLENFYFQSETYEVGTLDPQKADPAVYDGKVTVLHMMIYATEVLRFGVAPAEAGKGYLKDQNLMAENCMPSGNPGSLYMTAIWGMDSNLNYYVQHAFPQAGPRVGSTMDQKLLHQGDVVTLGHFSDFMFFQDPRAPFNHIEVNGTADSLTLDVADTVSLQVIHDGGGVSGDATTYKNIDYAVDVYAADVGILYGGSVASWRYVGTTDETGALSVTGRKIADLVGSGDVILGVPGQKGQELTRSVVCAPAAFHMGITDNMGPVNAVIEQITALPAADKITLDDFGEVKYARIAYESLTDEQKALVNNLDTLKAAEAKLAELKQPAEVYAYWPNFRGSDSNMAVVDAKTPTSPESVELKWNVKKGSGWAAAPSPMIIVDDAMIVMVGSDIYKLDLKTGEELARGKMVASIGFGIVIPTYGQGMIFCPLSNGRVQAFDATTLESLWVFQDELQGQPNCPITYADGMIYTGFWNSETKSANYVGIDVRDENPVMTHEAKEAIWTKPAMGGYYWAGSVVVGNAVIFGTDDGTSGTEGTGAHLYALNKDSGSLISDLTGLIGDQRSSIAYSAEKGRVYFTTKGGYLYSAAVHPSTGVLSDLKSSKLNSNQSTSTPVVYGNQVYLCCGAGVGGNGANNFTVADADTLKELYSVPMKAYPQCSPLVSTAYMETEGKLYIYMTYNGQPGGITLVKVDPTKSTADGAELIELYDAKGFEQYCICSIICDANGTLYYKNDSCNILAVGTNAQKAADAVDAKIAAIGKVTLASEDAIKAARAAYDALTVEQQKLVKNLATLKAAELQMAELKAVTATVTISLEQDNYYAVAPAAYEVSSALSDRYGYTDELVDKVTTLDVLIKAHEIMFADDFTPETKNDFLAVNDSGFITTMMGQSGSNMGFAVNGMSPNDGVIDDAYGTYTGYTIGQAPVADQDVVQFFFYNPDGYWGEIYTNFLQGEEHITALDMTVGQEQVLTLKGYSFVYEGCNPQIQWKPVADAQICTLNLDSETTGSLVPIQGAVTDESGNVRLTFAEPGTYYLGVTSDPDNLTYIIPQICKVTVADLTPDQKAAAAVSKQIAALPAAAEITLDHETAVVDARAAYDKLTPAQQKLVTNLEVLTAAEAKLAELKEAAQTEANQKAAAAVDAKITAIGTVTLESEKAITEARAAYDELTDAQKALVTKLAVLEAAEAKLAELKDAAAQAEADKAAAAAVDAKITAIGTVTLESEKAITDARAAYDKLTPAQQKLVTKLSVLEAAEAQLAELKEAAQAEADQKAAAAVEAKIAAIGEVTLNSEAAITEARAAYNALTDAQKALVKNLDTLTAAEAKLAELKKEPEDLQPDSFHVIFKLADGTVVLDTVLEGLTGINAPEAAAGVSTQWTADCIDLVLNTGDYISAQTLDLDFTWTEKNPEIVFTSSYEAPHFVQPDSFHVIFKLADGTVVLDTVLEGLTGINAPEAAAGVSTQWTADCIDLVLNTGDYISAQTLDLDFTWTEKNPEIVFTSAYEAPHFVQPDSFHVIFKLTDGTVVLDTVLEGLTGINAPEAAAGVSTQWTADCIDLVLNTGDYISAQTLDLDFTWTEKNPEIVFTSTYVVPPVVELEPIQAQFVKNGWFGSRTTTLTVEPDSSVQVPDANGFFQHGNCWKSEDGSLYVASNGTVTYAQLLNVLGGAAEEGAYVRFVVTKEQDKPQPEPDPDPQTQTVVLSFQENGVEVVTAEMRLSAEYNFVTSAQVYEYLPEGYNFAEQNQDYAVIDGVATIPVVAVSDPEPNPDPVANPITVTFKLTGWGSHLAGGYGKTMTVTLNPGQSVEAPFAACFFGRTKIVNWTSDLGYQVTSGKLVAYENLAQLMGEVPQGASVTFTGSIR